MHVLKALTSVSACSQLTSKRIWVGAFREAPCGRAWRPPCVEGQVASFSVEWGCCRWAELTGRLTSLKAEWKVAEIGEGIALHFVFPQIAGSHSCSYSSHFIVPNPHIRVFLILFCSHQGRLLFKSVRGERSWNVVLSKDWILGKG